MLWLEDLHQGFARTTSFYKVTAEEIIEFAERYDPQPFHTDAAAAEETFFEGLAASGWHTAAISMRLLVTEALPLARGSVGIGVELAWPSPTRPGDQLRLELRVTDVRRSRSKPDRGVVSLAFETVNQAGEVRQRATAKALVFARGA